MAIEIGQSLIRIDAHQKVRGQEKYTADLFQAGMLWAGVKRAHVPCARLLSVETQTAKALSGTVAVLTARDVPGTNRQGITHKDQPVLVEDRIHRTGDAVALVVAKDKASLQKALDLISFTIDELPGVFDPSGALKADAHLVHPDHEGGNLLAGLDHETGNGSRAFADCKAVVTGEFRVPRQEHAYLETEAGLARLGPDGQLVVTVATQAPFRDRLEVAQALGLDPLRIRIKTPAMGGGFGGKDGSSVQCLLALAALNANGRPVMMIWDRKESFAASTKRLGGRLKYRLGADDQGRLLALECHIHLDNGAYANLGAEVLSQCLESAGGPYRIPHVSLHGRTVYTNNPVAGPFRGFGAPQAAFAMEQMMDILAHRLHMDPLHLRRMNALERGDENILGLTLKTSTGIGMCIEELSDHSLWQTAEAWKKKAPPFRKRGKGLACILHSVGFGPRVPDYATAKIRLTREGKFRVYSGIVDMGQGNAPTYLQIAGERLNQRMADLELVLPDTGRTLPSGSASASRCTYIFGNALIKAAENLHKTLLERGASFLNGDDHLAHFVLLPGAIRHLPTGKRISLTRLAGYMARSERTATGYFRAPTAPDVSGPQFKMSGLGMGHGLFSYGAHMALVEVDEITGRVQVAKYLAVSDCGRVINPQIFEQQVQGGIVQGLGYGLLEDFKVREGHIQTEDFATYILPTSLDVPEMISIAIQTHEPTGPYGLKGVGELPICGPLPAVANGVADALGVRIHRAPLTAERVLAALIEKQGKDKP
ncbi:MAG TPA: xanthine dehydrogenase family protein molybdopterin-binding subunit [Desulfobacteria bacterium]|nr:xanthine dehydrogenase family protein molybdopterin-binding subunit [Desulfobacteria bacterium]